MSEMTPEKATALRQPFPKESVGKLPKPMKRDAPKGQCSECGGWHGLPAVHLDYVGHAATTDRLLTVDPEWTWEPMGVDQCGLPVPDAQGNLWIRLTVCGVTRIGVGDGASAKERIGDAIRNAAMRFGVALDLWSKEELVEFAQAARQRQAAPAPETPEADSPPREPPLLNTRSSLAKAMYAGINGIGIADDERIPFIVSVIDRQITSTKEMTEPEARQVLARIDQINTPGGAMPDPVDAELVEEQS